MEIIRNQCKNHQTRVTSTVCTDCNKPICKSCTTTNDNKPYCKPCYNDIKAKKMIAGSKAWAKEMTNKHKEISPKKPYRSKGDKPYRSKKKRATKTVMKKKRGVTKEFALGVVGLIAIALFVIYTLYGKSEVKPIVKVVKLKVPVKKIVKVVKLKAPVKKIVKEQLKIQMEKVTAPFTINSQAKVNSFKKDVQNLPLLTSIRLPAKKTENTLNELKQQRARQDKATKEKLDDMKRQAVAKKAKWKKDAQDRQEQRATRNAQYEKFNNEAKEWANNKEKALLNELTITSMIAGRRHVADEASQFKVKKLIAEKRVLVIRLHNALVEKRLRELARRKRLARTRAKQPIKKVTTRRTYRRKCPKCNGSGWKVVHRQGRASTTVDCSTCNGAKYIYKKD